MKSIAAMILVVLLILPIGFAQESATILEQRITYKLQEGKVTKHVYQKVKLHTPASYRVFGESFFIYNPKAVAMDILKSETTQVDGTVVPTPENGILVQSPYATMNAPDYSFMREHMVSHIGLEPGCTIEFEYRIRDLIPWRVQIYEPMEGNFRYGIKEVQFVGFNTEKMIASENLQRQGDVIKVENTKAHRLNAEFSTTDDSLFVYLPLSDPIQSIKQRSQSDVVEPILERIKLDKHSHPLEVSSQLKHFLDNRLASVSLSLEQSAYHQRTLDQIVKSGYATDFEKARLAMAVMGYYKMKYDVYFGSSSSQFLNDPTVEVRFGGVGVFHPKATNRPFQFSMDGNVQPMDAPLVMELYLDFKEDLEGKWKGNMYFDRSGTNLPPIKAMNPLKDLKTDAPDFSVKTKNSDSGMASCKWVPGSDRVIWDESLGEAFDLDRLLTALQTVEFTRINQDLSLSMKVHLHFREPKEFLCPKDYEVKNEMGSISFKYLPNKDQFTATVSFHIRKGRYDRNSFEGIEALIGRLIQVDGQTSLF